MTPDDDVLALAAADAGGEASVMTAGEGGVSRLSRLAAKLVNQQAELSRLEELVKQKKQDIEVTQTKELPDLMRDLGVKTYEFTDGSKLAVKEDFAISIKADHKDEALDWIETKGHGGVIKVKVVAEFGKGEFEEAKRFRAAAQTLLNDRDVVMDRSVHPMTLKSWAKEVRADQDLHPEDRLPVDPDSPFTVFDYSKAEVKLPKPKKQR
jgi:hypothetical protein